jgi:hypothetical protein
VRWLLKFCRLQVLLQLLRFDLQLLPQLDLSLTQTDSLGERRLLLNAQLLSQEVQKESHALQVDVDAEGN